MEGMTAQFAHAKRPCMRTCPGSRPAIGQVCPSLSVIDSDTSIMPPHSARIGESVALTTAVGWVIRAAPPSASLRSCSRRDSDMWYRVPDQAG
jgi:hypothetical protein